MVQSKNREGLKLESYWESDDKITGALNSSMLWADQMSEFVLCSFRCQDLFRCKIHGRGADHRQRITEAVYPKVEHSMKATSWLSRGGLGIDFIVLAQHGRGAHGFKLHTT